MLSTILVIILVICLIYFTFIAPRVTNIEVAFGEGYISSVWMIFWFLLAIISAIFGWPRAAKASGVFMAITVFSRLLL